MIKYNPTPLSWLYNKLLCTPDITIYECTNALETADKMNDEQTILFLSWLRLECSNRSDGWRHIASDDLTVYTDLGIYNKWFTTKR
jgi:hypothetical protein